MKHLPSSRLSTIPKTTVWSVFTPLAIQHKAVNLGQGFPSFSPPDFSLKEGSRVWLSPETPLDHQYARSQGNLQLVEYLQQRYTRELGMNVKLENVLVQAGATQALNCITQAWISNGDEVLMLEPFFDVYGNNVELAGGRPVAVPLTPGTGNTSASWKVDFDRLERACTSKTKMIMINTPQNVPGKVWSLEELQQLAAFAIRRNLIVLSDEVYEYMTFDGAKHHHIASLPGMWERTLTVSSAGKTLSATGWKIGWIVGPADLIAPCTQIHAHQVFAVNTPSQIVVAKSLRHAEESDYFAQFRKFYEDKRSLLCTHLSTAGIEPIIPQGSFFALADITKVNPKHYMNPKSNSPRDWQFCQWLTTEIGVTAIPTTAFCTTESAPQFERFVRFAFCKDDALINEGGNRLKRLREFM